VQPFLLPTFLTPIIFALEFIRQRLDYDHIHFVSRKYKASFKLKKEVGPFIVNTRSTLQVAEKLLQDMGFQQGEIWMYDPHAIISSKRIENGLVPYQHQQKAQLELLANQDSWEDVQRILQVQEKVLDQPSKSPVTETPQQFEKIYKRKSTDQFQKCQRQKKKDQQKGRKQKDKRKMKTKDHKKNQNQ
jgi:hypothetical protein